MKEDKQYCMSSFLMFRTIEDHGRNWGSVKPNLWEDAILRKPIHDSRELEEYLHASVQNACSRKKLGLALSGGIDSAILARFMPKGSVAYTFKCVVPDVEVMDETAAAAKFASECGLEHKIVEIHWEDVKNASSVLMKHKCAPIHSIEAQIYLGSVEAKADGLEGMLFGENADIIYGGMSNLLSKDWTFGEFVDRYSYILPYKVLKDAELILEPYKRHEKNGYMDVYAFMNDVFRIEAMGSYTNAAQTAGIEAICPFAETVLAVPLDQKRIRSGDGKYFVREVFRRLYPDVTIPPKTPMPRPMDEWLRDWRGPVREEFWRHCTDHMTGDQKWLVWCLEKFLNLIDEEK